MMKQQQKSDTGWKPTKKIIDDSDVSSDNIVRLKVTIRKGARIESFPLKKLEKLATQTNLYWTYEHGWLKLIGTP